MEVATVGMLVLDCKEQVHRERAFPQIWSRDLGKQVHSLDHDRGALRHRSLYQRVDPRRDVGDLAQEAGDGL
jgi:hypothetical protein